MSIHSVDNSMGVGKNNYLNGESINPTNLVGWNSNIVGAPCSPIPSAQQEYLTKKEIDFRYAAADRRDRTNNKILFEQQKAGIAIKKQETIEKHRRERENASVEIAQTERGELVILTRYSSGNIDVSLPIFNIVGMWMQCLFCSDESVGIVEKIQWDGNEKGMLLYGERRNSKAFGKHLLNHGITVNLSRRKKETVLDKVYAYLVDNAGQKEIPKSYGWNRLQSGEWIFEKNPKNTMEGLVYEL